MSYVDRPLIVLLISALASTASAEEPTPAGSEAPAPAKSDAPILAESEAPAPAESEASAPAESEASIVEEDRGAEASTPVTEQSSEVGELRWSVGAGIGMPSFADNIRELAVMLDVPVAIVAASRRPELQLLLERRASEKLHFMFQVSGDYTRHIEEDPEDYDFRDKTKITGTVIGGSVGLRYTTNPGGLVEVSVFGVGALSLASLHRKTENLSYGGAIVETDGSATTFGLGVGFALDRELLEGLFLRFSTLVFKATYTTGSGDYRDSDISFDYGTASRLLAGVELKPSIQLRMSF
jgi:hypothetical protein